MTALSFETIMAEALRVASAYPGIAQRIAMGDPLVVAELAGQARMVAMLSEQVEVARYEPFERTRDAVVLADAAMRGILPMARPAVAALAVTNTGGGPITTRPGRMAIDEKGRVWQCSESVTVQSGDTGRVRFVQRAERVMSMMIDQSARFMRVEVPMTGAKVASIEVTRVRGAVRDRFAHRADLCNVAAGDLAYTLETDERRRLYVRFGAAGTIGYQPAAGDRFEVAVAECDGRVDGMRPGAAWVWRQTESIADDSTAITLAALDEEGADPPTMRELRMLSRYPTVFNADAVHLGNFDFVLRRGIGSGIRFLSVWNEQIEEQFRGASVANVNKLFVSALVSGAQQPQVRDQVEAIVRRADDSLRVVHVPVVMTPVPVSVSATVSAVHDEVAVAARIRELMLSELGDGSADVSAGMRTPIRSAVVHRMLREGVIQLRDDACDINVSIRAPERVTPEMFLHVTPESLDVTVSKYDGRRYGGWGID